MRKHKDDIDIILQCVNGLCALEILRRENWAEVEQNIDRRKISEIAMMVLKLNWMKWSSPAKCVCSCLKERQKFEEKIMNMLNEAFDSFCMVTA